MQVFIVALLLGFALVAAKAARAAEPEQRPLELRPKLALEAGAHHGASNSMFERGGAPVIDFSPARTALRERPASGCSEHALCYDSTEGHIVYRPARAFMPDIPGLKRENISVKRHIISFRYSF